MKPSRIERLRRAGIRKGVRTSKKLRHVLSRNEVLALKIQILPAAPRIAFALAGGLLLTAAVFAWPAGSEPVRVIEGMAGLFLLLFGVFGIRRTLSGLENQMSFEIFEALVEGILSAIGNSIDL